MFTNITVHCTRIAKKFEVKYEEIPVISVQPVTRYSLLNSERFVTFALQDKLHDNYDVALYSRNFMTSQLQMANYPAANY